MKIKELQSGGMAYTPFFRDSVTQSSQPTQPNSTQSGDKEEQLIQKEIINVLKENGLQNDVDYFLSRANSFLTKSKGLFDTGASYDMSDLIRIQSLANRIKRNKELHTEAEKQIIKEGSGSEAAVSSTGNLYVQDSEGKIQVVSASNYYKNRDKYAVLTNNELIRVREDIPELAYNSSILTDLSNTVGIKSIVDYIKATINSFGTDKTESSTQHFTTKQRDQIERGLEQIIGGGPDGVYKVSGSVKTENQGYSDQESLNAAVQYLWSTLPKNMQNVLKATTAAEGGNPGSAKDVQNLLLNAVLEHTNHSYATEQKADFDTSATKEWSGGASGGTEKETKQTRAEMIATMPMNTQLPIWGSSDQHSLIVDAANVGKPMKRNGEQIGRSTIVDMFSNDDIGQMSGLDSISFGGTPMSETDSRRIMYDGVSDIYKAYFPVNKNIMASTGQVVPDLDALERFKKFQEWIDSGYGIMPNSIAMKLRELDLDLLYDQNSGEWYFNPNSLQGFFITNGYASSAIIDLDKKSKWLSHINPNDGETIFDQYARILNFGTDSPTKNATSREGIKRKWWRPEDNTMYKSMIAVPITEPTIATLTTNHQTVPSEVYRDIFNRQRSLAESRNMRTNW